MPQAELLIASQNPGKLNEMRLLLEGLPFRVLSPRDLGILTAPEETGSTFLENATLKALDYARRSGRLTVADDSGLSVDALDGGPGLYSSRFGGEGAGDLDRNRLLLERLRGVPRERRGKSGFGYDPLFFYPPLGKTFGELPREDKDRVSHRGKAFARLREFLAASS